MHDIGSQPVDSIFSQCLVQREPTSPSSRGAHKQHSSDLLDISQVLFLYSAPFTCHALQFVESLLRLGLAVSADNAAASDAFNELLDQRLKPLAAYSEDWAETIGIETLGTDERAGAASGADLPDRAVSGVDALLLKHGRALRAFFDHFAEQRLDGNCLMSCSTWMGACHTCGVVNQNVTFSQINHTFVRINQLELQQFFGNRKGSQVRYHFYVVEYCVVPGVSSADPANLEKMGLDYDEFVNLVVATALLDPPRFPGDFFVRRLQLFLR